MEEDHDDNESEYGSQLGNKKLHRVLKKHPLTKDQNDEVDKKVKDNLFFESGCKIFQKCIEKYGEPNVKTRSKNKEK